MIPLVGLFFNKYLISAVAGASILAGIYFYGYDKGYNSADLKWKDKNAEQIVAAVQEANKVFKAAKEADITTMGKLRKNRDYYKKLYKNTLNFKPTSECELTDRMFLQFNSGLTGEAKLSK